MIKLCPRNYLVDIYHCAKFYCNSFTGSLPQICEILRFCDFFYCPVLSWLYFFSRNCAQVEPLDGFLTVYGSNDTSSPTDVPFGGLDDDPQY